MLASDATISAHASAVTDAGDSAAGQAAGTGYSSSRRASSSRLICEISPSASRSRREISTREPTASASAAGTYIRWPAACRYTYGPCGSPLVHLHSSFPQLRCCSTSAPGSSASARGRAATRWSRRARSSAVLSWASPDFLFVIITQDYDGGDNGGQRHHRPC